MPLIRTRLLTRSGWHPLPSRPTWRLHPGIAIALVTAVAVGWIFRGIG